MKVLIIFLKNFALANGEGGIENIFTFWKEEDCKTDTQYKNENAPRKQRVV